MTTPKFKRLSIGNSPFLYYDNIIIDEYSGQLIFASLLSTDALLKSVQAEVNRINSVYVETLRKYVSTQGAKYDTEKRKQSNSDFSHLICCKKDEIEFLNNDNEILTAYIYSRPGIDTIEDRVYDKLYKHTAIPIIKEWMPYLVAQLVQYRYLRPLTVESIHGEKPFLAFRLQISKEQLQAIVQGGLRTQAININGSNAVSPLMSSIEGLDSYLNVFGDILAYRIQESFKPKFVPNEDEYDEWVDNYDDSCYHAGVEIYAAQKAVIQSCVNQLNEKNVAFVIGEMGIGKTLIGSGIAYAHHKNKTGMNSIIMCPSHLVEKWKREVEKFVPNAKGYIVTDIKELIELVPKIKNCLKLENSFIIISKEVAKFSYETRPVTPWSKSKKTFVCPCCGQPLIKKVRIGTGRAAQTIEMNFTELDMLTQMSHNTRCTNKVQVYNKHEHKYEEQECNALLWGPLNKLERNMKWAKLGSLGWILQEHVDKIFSDFAGKETLSKKEAAIFSKVIEIKEVLDNGENLKGLKAPRKYSLAKYIRERLKGDIDYFICDELHLQKGNTKQGQAMADIASASKKFIGLTGTLLNGYADGLFYILYRTVPELMKRDDFEYSDEMNFMRTYGVIKKSSKCAFVNGRRGEKIGTGSEKRLPGVSPLVFTKYLLENASFISLSDIDGGLPGYEEIPIEIDMDDELKQAYQTLERELRGCIGWRSAGGVKAMGALLQSLSVYPDMPYNQPAVLHPDTNEVLVTPPQLAPGLRVKENRLLEMVQEKIANGEKVLVYYEWTNRTDVAQKLNDMFKENGINSVVLTSSVAAIEREEWIEKKLDAGIDVLICNPKLVETGLDLLAFTNIVFYQIGYNIFTMRQASRRSWRLSQDRDIRVYFFFYKETIQAQALSLMATKLQASMAIEGKFSEEGLRAMSNNEDLLTQIANSVVEGIKHTVATQVFHAVEKKEREHDTTRERLPLSALLVYKPIIHSLSYLARPVINKKNNKPSLLRDIISGKQNVGNLI